MPKQLNSDELSMVDDVYGAMMLSSPKTSYCYSSINGFYCLFFRLGLFRVS